MILVLSGFSLILLLYTQKERFQNQKKLFCILIALYFFGIAAFREITGDAIDYARAYAHLPATSFSSLFADWQNDQVKDFVFYAVAKVFADIGISAQVWIAAIALLFAVAFGRFLYKFADEPMIGTLLMLTLFFSFTLTGLRQTVALAIIFFSYEFILERKPISFVLTVGLAFLFHSSALVFLPAYWIAKIKFGWKQYTLIGVFLLIAVFKGEWFRQLIELLAWNESMERYAHSDTKLSWAGYIIQACILFFCIFAKKNMTELSQEKAYRLQALLNCMAVGLCIQSFSAVVAEAFRISTYYFMCCTAAVPLVVDNQKSGKDKTIMYLGVGAALLAYMLYAGTYSNLKFLF